MSDFASLPEGGLDRWLADQHHALVNDLAATLDLEAGLREAMIPARHADLVAGLRDVLDVEAGLSAIVSTTPDDPFEADPESWPVEESPSSSGSVAVAVRRGASARVFVSHAIEDRALAEELERQLVADGHQVFLNQHTHDYIAVGEEWEQWLRQRLEWADAMVCVVTSAYVASRQCAFEVAFAQSMGDLLLPVQAEPGVDDPLLRSVTDIDMAPDSAAAALVRTLRRVDDTGALDWPKDRSPFPGLEPFTAVRSRVFFGRAAEAREVGNRLRGTAGVMAVVGPSGCGKSSLLNAAVVPMLDRDSTWLVVPSLVPGSDPLPELARALANTAEHLELGWSSSDVRSRLEAGTDGLHRVADDLLAASPGTNQRRLLVSIDQAEELFTRTTPAALQRFTRLLREAIAGPVQVVAVMRSEFLDDLRDLPALAGVPIEAYVLAPLDREMLRDVIEQPARLARLRLDDGLVGQLIADTDNGKALPLLAFTLRQLADGLSAGATLSLARYRDLGGVRGALARHADVALAEAVRASGLTEREVLAGLTRLVTLDETGRRARRRIKLASLTAPLRAALGVFVERRLLLSDTDDIGQVWLTVAHEALLTGWCPLEVARADVIAALRAARAVEQAAAEWTSADRPDHYLWDDKRLTTTRAMLGMTGNDGHRNPAVPPIVELDDEARAFLDATT
ncbi:MAG: TIR domain-containing protein, partial [Pseudonocardiaceae bacterium]